MRLIFSSTTFATTFVACHSLAGVGSNLAAASIRDFTYYSDVEQPGLKTNSSFNEECPFGSASVTSHLRGSEVDAGILGCSDPEYVCIEDSLSSLGGRCAPPAVAHRELQNTPTCAVSCTGTNACSGSLDPNNIGVGSCCGYKACYGVSASSIIGDGSCIGYKACTYAQDATIGDSSCKGDSILGSQGYNGYICKNLKGTVGDNSCFEYAACYQKSSDGRIFDIGNNSCRGQESCEYTGGSKIGDESCNEYYACYKSSAEIGVGSCNARKACTNNTAPIGDDVCNTAESCIRNSSPLTKSPSKAPTKSPTSDPTKAPTSSPTKVPTNKPTLSPMKGPTKQPLPTLVPTKSPTMTPITSSPSKHPSMNPTSGPTKAPMMRPTTFPTPSPSKKPSLPTLPGKSSKEDEKSKSAKSMNTKSSKAGTMQFQETGETSTYELTAKPSHKSTPKSMEKEVPYWISAAQTANSDGKSTDLMTVVTWTYQEEVDMNDEFIRS